MLRVFQDVPVNIRIMDATEITLYESVIAALKIFFFLVYVRQKGTVNLLNGQRWNLNLEKSVTGSATYYIPILILIFDMAEES